jgi:hypothetical protein
MRYTDFIEKSGILATTGKVVRVLAAFMSPRDGVMFQVEDVASGMRQDVLPTEFVPAAA